MKAEPMKAEPKQNEGRAETPQLGANSWSTVWLNAAGSHPPAETAAPGRKAH